MKIIIPPIIRDTMQAIKERIRQTNIPIGFLLVSFIYSYSFSLQHIFKNNDYILFETLVRGQATTPFQYRVLIPWLARIFQPYIELLPFIGSLNGIQKFFEFVSIFATLAALFYFSPSLITEDTLSPSKRNTIRWLSLWLLILALPSVYLASIRLFYYPSDIPSILFMILGLIFLRRQKWWLYYPNFILGTFNRETICFLTLTHLLTNWKSTPRSKLLLHLLAQALLWIGIKSLLWWIYSANTSNSIWFSNISGLFKNSWQVNLNTLRDPLAYGAILSVYGYLWIPLIILWNTIPDRWLKSAILTVPLFHLAMLVPGEIIEMRLYGEMLPFVILGVVAGLTTSEKSKNIIKDYLSNHEQVD